MAAAAHFSANVYGRVYGQPPYQGSTSEDAFANLVNFTSPAVMSFPTTGTIFHPVTPGQRVGNSTNYIYAVIEVVSDGQRPQPENIKYGAGESVSTLATNAG
jgi:hypothetical protein